ncbi:MAG: pilus assembly protein PilM [Paludibacteraceae bacterium]|nr:pilus assembly protein PilM [Paludibacteraceae bacterium]
MAKKQNTKQTTDQLPLVAVDMGSQSFKFAAAEQTDSSYPCTLRILAVEKSDKYSGVVHKGVIKNTTNASYRLRESLLLIGNRLGRARADELPTAFTLYGGKSMRAVDITAKRSQGTYMPVSQKKIDEMREECFLKAAKLSAGMTGLDARLYSLSLDNTEYSSLPANARATHIEARFSTFYGMDELKDKVQGTFDRAGKSIEKAFARPEALLEALATEEDELAGVCIIDMGAETTTISIYKNGRYLTCRTLPFGGSTITADIEQLGIPTDRAEKLKLKYGNAVAPTTEQDGTVRIPARNEGEKDVFVKLSFLSKIITSRLNELMAPIFRELQRYEDEIATVYLTGGASMMQGMVGYVQQHTKLRVAYGSHAEWLAEGTPDALKSPEYSALIGALLLGAKYRKNNPGKTVGDTPIKKGFLERIGDLFTPPAN